MKPKTSLTILAILWIILIVLMISDILGISTYEDTRYIFYALIILNAIITFFALKKNKYN